MKIESLVAAHDDSVRWSIDARDATFGQCLFELNAHQVLKTASVAKVHLLCELADRFTQGRLDPLHPLDRRSVQPIADSGLWQHLATDVLPAVDVARLVGAVSDNLAANVLLDHLGLDAVQQRGRQLAPDGSLLHDIVRDQREPGDTRTLSTGTAADWATLFQKLQDPRNYGPSGSMVLDWLSVGTDLSMVASAFGLDPLAHGAGPDRGFTIWNKTGTDRGIRADVGLVNSEMRSVTYAVLCNWDPSALPDPRDRVLATMGELGALIRDYLVGPDQTTN